MYSIFKPEIIIVDLNRGVPVPVPVSVPENIISLVTWSVTYRDIIFDIPDYMSILYSVTSSAYISVATEIILIFAFEINFVIMISAQWRL